MVGNLNALMEQLPSTRARTDALLNMYRIADDAVEAEQRRDTALEQEREARTRRDAAERKAIADALTELRTQIDALKEEADYQKRLDKAERIREALDDLHQHQPGGELHDLGPTELRGPSSFELDRR
jgi:hypothetical protein